MLAEHYERPARIIALYEKLQEEGLTDRCWQLVARKVRGAVRPLPSLVLHTAGHVGLGACARLGTSVQRCMDLDHAATYLSTGLIMFHLIVFFTGN